MRIKQDKEFISIDQDQYVKIQLQGLKSHLSTLVREKTFHYQSLLFKLEWIVLLLKNKRKKQRLDLVIYIIDLLLVYFYMFPAVPG